MKTQASIRRGVGALVALLVLGAAAGAQALTAPGTVIENTASLNYTTGSGAILGATSNTATTTVQELVDVDVSWQDASEVPVAAGDADQVLTFVVTNAGNGDEAYRLSLDTTLTTDDFDPDTATIYIETDGVAGFSAGDTLYDPADPPVIASEASLTVYVLGDIPGAALNGQTADVQLTASSDTLVGAPGDVLAGGGAGGTDAVAGTSGGDDSAVGGYVVSQVTVTFDKTESISDPFGGAEAIPGSIITYTLTVTVTGSGTATGVVLSDPIPVNTTYVAGSIILNDVAQTDASDSPTDESELDVGGNQVVATLGDIVAGAAAQVLTFQVTID